MKHLRTYGLATLLVFSLSCKEHSEPKNKTLHKEVKEQSSKVSNSDLACYLFTNSNNDSIQLVVKRGMSQVTGRLIYNFYEKDANFGSIKGQFYGDTLKANYVFQAEGTTSEREVMFLKQGDRYIPGYGELVTNGNKSVFKKDAVINFDTNTMFETIDCKVLRKSSAQR
ncbi:hypothetical protein ACU8DI_11295 [Psychroserpens sp. BH13MA-6]